MACSTVAERAYVRLYMNRTFSALCDASNLRLYLSPIQRSKYGYGISTNRRNYHNNDWKASEARQDVAVPAQKSFMIRSRDPATSILANAALVVTRQIEMLNIFLGFEQSNKYAILDPHGNNVGYIAEEESLASTVLRQLFRTHRKFNALVLAPSGEIVLKISRPFAWINSRIFISTENDELVGEVQQQWHLWRRRYNLFVGLKQFARIDAGFWAWDFVLEDEDGTLLGSVNRNFRGFGREIFTDTGQYVIRMDALEGHHNTRAMSLDERAVALAAAVSIDFDYFSRHSEKSPFLFFEGGE